VTVAAAVPAADTSALATRSEADTGKTLGSSASWWGPSACCWVAPASPAAAGGRPADLPGLPWLVSSAAPTSEHADEEGLPAHASAHLLQTSVGRLNQLRAAVLGGNDGMTSTAGLVVGVAATGAGATAVALAGVSGVVAGALSMGGGEFTSVRAQRDSQDALLRHQVAELELVPEEELDELTHLYVEKGLSLRLARVLHRILAMTTELRSAQAQYASPRDGSTVTTDAVA